MFFWIITTNVNKHCLKISFVFYNRYISKINFINEIFSIAVRDVGSRVTLQLPWLLLIISFLYEHLTAPLNLLWCPTTWTYCGDPFPLPKRYSPGPNLMHMPSESSGYYTIFFFFLWLFKSFHQRCEMLKNSIYLTTVICYRRNFGMYYLWMYGVKWISVPFMQESVHL